MRWRGRRGSDNLEDRRGQAAGGMSGRAKIGGGIGLVVVIVGALLGADVSSLLGLAGGGGGGQATAPGPTRPRNPAEEEQVKFVSVILADTEQTWTRLFAQQGQQYQKPKLVVFTDGVDSACGFQSKAVGPFYCPADRKAYLDLSFFQQLERQLGAPGDFARAYVIAHEIGHHIQNLIGVSNKVHSQRRRVSKTEGNKLSVRQELQADCFAGVWAHYAHKERKMLEPGDIEEGLNAAKAIGDDALQRKSTGHVRPESWTHGSSKQRMTWFMKGFKGGQMAACDTFAVARP
jgi:predicted metalloprotease